jgi:hypothetical protein
VNGGARNGDAVSSSSTKRWTRMAWLLVPLLVEGCASHEFDATLTDTLGDVKVAGTLFDQSSVELMVGGGARSDSSGWS